MARLQLRSLLQSRCLGLLTEHVPQGANRNAGRTNMPNTSTQSGVIITDPLDEVLAELEVDPLDALIAELDRIVGHETMLQDAVADNKAVVVHPRPEALAARSAPETPATPRSFVVQGGLASFEVAQDLLYLDFSQPERAPQEFRVLPYNPERITSLSSGISGSFGQLDPASVALHEYLRRIQQQAQQVRSLIDGQRQLRPDRKVLAPGRSSADLHTDQIGAGQIPHNSMLAPAEPPTMPRTSEGAVSIEAKLGRSCEGQTPAGPTIGPSKGGLQEVTAVPHVTITLHSATTRKGEENHTHHKEQKILRADFYGNTEPKRPAAGHEAAQADTGAVLRLVLFVAGFGFYLFTRSTTMDARGSAPLFLYQLAVLLAESLHFVSGCLVGIWQTRSVHSSKQRSHLRGQARQPDKESTDASLPALGPASAKRPFRIQVIIDAKDKPLRRLLQTVVAVRDTRLPKGSSQSIHVIYDARQHGQAQMSEACLDGITLHDVSTLQEQPDHLTVGSSAAYVNTVLRFIYPKGEDIATEDVVAFFRAGQVGADAFLQLALPALALPDVRMVYSRAATSKYLCYTDIYNQGEEYWLAVIAPHAPAWQCTAVPGQPAFLIYASSLHNMGWLPDRPGAEASAVAECLARGSRLAVPHPQSPVEGCSPAAIPETYQAAFRTAQGRLRQLSLPGGPRARWDSSMRPLLQHTLAWCTIVSALSTLLFTVIPLIRIIYGVFPFSPNRWFGMGFLVYYCCCSPLLYQVWTLRRAILFWDWHVSSRILWWEHLKAVSKFLPIFRLYRYLARRHRQPQRDTEEGVSADERVVGVRRRQVWHFGRVCRQLCLDGALAQDVPWRAVWACALLLFGACVGTWLLLHDFQIALGPRRQVTMLSLFATNLSLFLSVLWCLCNGLVYALPCCYAATIWSLRKGEDGHSVPGRRCPLALLSMLALSATVCCMLLAVIACIGLGEGALTLQGAPVTQDYDYTDALAASMQFYSAQRSGALGADYPVTWRGDSGLTDNPVGGYYLGTNNLKLTLPIAAATFQMAWGIASLPGNGEGMHQQVFTEIRWAADYMLACFGGSSLVTQVGDTAQELSLWDRPEDMNHTRPSFSVNPEVPGADVMAHTAAALAAASAVLGGQDALYAEQLLNAAQSLYRLASANEGLSSSSAAPNATLYNSTSYLDDLMLASAWLAVVSGRPAYAAEAETYWKRIVSGSNKSWQSLVADWNNQWWAGNVILAGLTGNHSYQAQVEAFIAAWTPGGSGVAYTPQGLAAVGSEGVLRNAANAALVALVHARHSSGFGAVRLACWARNQIRYILGAGGRSYVVGWGVDPPTHIPSPAASCPSAAVPCAAPRASSLQYASPGPNPHSITGALVSGPSAGDALSDVRSDPDTAISVEYNGGFSGALAMLAAKEWAQTCNSRPGLIDRAGGHLQHSVW